MNQINRPNWSMKWATPAAAIGFIALLSLVRLWFLSFSSYTLAEDEAHYWEWAQHLDWSYYSKGPGVAWVIAASTSIFGDTEWAVRLPAVIAGALSSIAAGWCASLTFPDRRAFFFGAVLFNCIPPFQLIALLMTIDGPYIACWTLACALALKARQTGRSRWLIATGLALALGFLFKYTIILLAIGLVPALLSTKNSTTFRPTAWLACAAVCALGLLPVTLWNAQHDWVTIRHLLGHLGLAGGDLPPSQGMGQWNYSPLWTIEYLAMLLLIGPVGVLGTIGFLRFLKTNPQLQLIAWASTPVLVFYLIVTFVTEAEGNWALGGFVGFAIAAAGVAPIALDRRQRVPRTIWRLALIAFILSFFGFTNLALLAQHPRLGHIIPLHRVHGMREHAAAVESHLAQLEAETGLSPFVITSHYGRTSQLAFYLPSNRQIFTSGSFSHSGRKSQHDLWQDRDLRNPTVVDNLRSRPALLIGSELLYWKQGFARVEELGYLPAEPNNRRLSFLGYDYRGIPDLSTRNRATTP